MRHNYKKSQINVSHKHKNQSHMLRSNIIAKWSLFFTVRHRCKFYFHKALLLTKCTHIMGDCNLFATMKNSFNNHIFPECVTKGSRLLLAVWGWRCVRGRLLLCSQPVAPGRNFAMKALAVRFGSLVRRVPWFCLASITLRNIPTSLVKCQKSIYVISALIFHYVPSTHHSQVSQHAIYFMTVHGQPITCGSKIQSLAAVRLFKTNHLRQ